MLQENKVLGYIESKGFRVEDPGVLERLEIKLLEYLEKAMKKAAEEGRKFLKASDIKVTSSHLKALRIEPPSRPETKPRAPLIERSFTSSRLGGFVTFRERTSFEEEKGG